MTPRCRRTRVRGGDLAWFALVACFCLGLRPGFAEGPPASFRAADPVAVFDAANGDYQLGRFEAAKAGYLQLVSGRVRSPALFYNLGNAWWQLGQKGRAVLNYRRALALDPGAADIGANLRMALRSTGQEPPSALTATLLRGVDWYPPATAVAGWLTVFAALAWWRARGRGRDVLAALTAVTAAGFLAGLTLCVWLGRGDKDVSRAVILPASVDVKIGPARSARISETVGEGQTVTVVSQRGEWIFCRTADGASGWLPAGSLERIVLP